MPEQINHPAAEMYAEMIRFRMAVATEALEKLQDALCEVTKGPTAGVVPSEVLAAYLFDTDETLLSVNAHSGYYLSLVVQGIRDRLADLTGTIRLAGAE